MTDYSEWMREDLINRINRLTRELDAAKYALDAAINMNIEKNAEVVRLTIALDAANEDAERLDKLIMDAICRQTSEIDTEAGLDAHRAHNARVKGGEE